MPVIHPTAVVMPGAVLAENVEVGPLSFVGPDVKIGAGTRLIAQCHVSGHTAIGENNVLHPFCAIGGPAQDHGVVPGEISYIEIGDNNVFRENTTVHSGTKPGTVTTIGSGCMFMQCTHVAHNCRIGNNVIMVGGAVIAGYCQIGDNALLSGLSALHQFCRVGRLAIISGGSAFSMDIPPFMMAEGRNGGVKMINLVGLKRAGFSDETIRVLRNLFKIYCRSGLSHGNALARIKSDLPQIPEVVEFLDFCASSQRGVLGGARDGHRD